jgi:hypothetical protein
MHQGRDDLADRELGAPTSLVAERARLEPAGDWAISRSWAIEPPSEGECDAAYIVRLTDTAGNGHDLVVEFVAPSVLTSVGYAEEIARPFRRESAPPSHVIVDRKGNVRAVGETHDHDR